MHQEQLQKRKLFSRRAFILGAVKAGLFSILGIRFYYLQLIEGNKYRSLAEHNRIRLVVIPPLRGTLLDCNGVVLANNRLSYSAVLDRLYIDDAPEIINRLDKILGYKTQISRIGLHKVLKVIGKDRYILLQENLSWLDITKIESRVDLQGVEIVVGQKRVYLYGNALCHITGYISKPNEKEIKSSLVPNYHEFQIGKDGVEKVFDPQLLGTPGTKKVEVNATGRFMKELAYTPATCGISLQLAIDIRLQKIVVSHLENLVGSVVVMHPYTGAVLAMYSSPTYDPNHFVGGISHDNWQTINKNPDNPLMNKAIAAQYPPGSIFKMVTALAILRCGIDPMRKVLCTGEYQLGQHTFRCWKKDGHGWINFEKAVTQSCNVYYYTCSQIAGINIIADTARILGLGQKTNIELPFENPGLIPDKIWKKQRFGSLWNHGDTVNMSIGQGYVLTTPLQLALMLSRIITAHAIIPRILKPTQQLNYAKLNIMEHHLNLLKNGLYKVFNEPGGTGYKNRISIPGFEMAGKTGTAQVIRQYKRNQQLECRKKDHSLFAGFIPYDTPQYVISIVIEHGGWGSKKALPLAIKIFSEYFGWVSSDTSFVEINI